jgi:hypothetical protein
MYRENLKKTFMNKALILQTILIDVERVARPHGACTIYLKFLFEILVKFYLS